MSLFTTLNFSAVLFSPSDQGTIVGHWDSTNGTSIAYSLPRRGLVLLDFYNVLGQRGGPAVEEAKRPGTFDAEFYAGSVAGAMYIYRLEFEGKVNKGKMILVK